MAHIGWTYLVTHVVAMEERAPDGATHTVHYFATDDGGLFDGEQSMLNELGAAGWELFLIREHESGPRHYFRRPRA